MPSDFHFSVRCHRDLTHRLELQPTDESFETYYKMMDVCEALGAEVLHLLTPARSELTDQKLSGIAEFFDSVDVGRARIAWEIRGGREREEWGRLVRIMQDHDIVHCVDLSVESPRVHSDILYARLFGAGRHNLYQFDDRELRGINDGAERLSKKAYLVFHGGRMYEDAARLKVYRETGRFPTAKGPVGVDSLASVLREDATFPSTTDELIKSQGWKVVDLTQTERVHSSVLLGRLPDKTFLSLEEVKRALGSVPVT